MFCCICIFYVNIIYIYIYIYVPPTRENLTQGHFYSGDLGEVRYEFWLIPWWTILVIRSLCAMWTVLAFAKFPGIYTRWPCKLYIYIFLAITSLSQFDRSSPGFLFLHCCFYYTNLPAIVFFEIVYIGNLLPSSILPSNKKIFIVIMVIIIFSLTLILMLKLILLIKGISIIEKSLYEAILRNLFSCPLTDKGNLLFSLYFFLSLAKVYSL